MKTSEKVYRLSDIEEHPLVAQYGLTQRQARRAVQSGRLEGVRPGGLIWLFTDSQIRAWITGPTDADK